MEVKTSTVVGMVAIVAIMMGGAIALKALGEDITIIITLVTLLALPVLGFFGVKFNENIQEIKTLTNGRDSKQLELIQEQQKALQENALVHQKAMHDNVVQLQQMVAQIALQATPPAAIEMPKELDDHTSPLHIPG